MEQRQYGLQDYFVILKRRRWQFLLPTLTLFAATALIAFFWPPTYRSSATILIEEPEVPRDLVSSTATGYADQRVQFITQKIMTTQNLSKIINQFNLYGDSGDRKNRAPFVEALRRATSLNLISANLGKNNKQDPQSTIAFTLSFEHGVPETAQAVLNELVSLYLNENVRTRLQQAEETTGFLTSEAAKLDASVKRLASELAEFKEKNAGRLPEQSQLNLQLLDQSERELIDVTKQRQSLDERKIFLEAKLAETSRYVTTVIDGKPVLSPAEQMRLKQTELISLQGAYGPNHPDVRKLSREIEALKAATGAQTDIDALEKQLGALQTELTVARKKYSANHPDVVRLQRQIAATKSALSDAQSKPRRPSTAQAKPDNPAYIQLQAQLEAVRSDRRALGAREVALKAKHKQLEERLLAAPQIERAYTELKGEYDRALANYREVSAKKTAAELGQALETERKGEQFSVIEPANLPLSPIRPNRRVILVLGFIFSVAVGVGIAALFERLDRSVYGATQLAAITGDPPLVVVPYIRNRTDTRQTWSRAALFVLGSTIAIIVGLFLINKYLLSLDTLRTFAGSLIDYLSNFSRA